MALELSAKDRTASQDTSAREMAARINGEVVLLLGWSPAILLQIAHPLVATGVAEHSSFDATPRKRVRRLRQTIEAMLALTFGTPHEAERAANTINAIHDRVHGQLDESAGGMPAGTRYSAHDPRLLSWVQITLLDSLLRTYELYVGPLSLEEKDRYCAEGRSLEPLLGMPGGTLPGDYDQLQRDLSRRLESKEIEVTDTARRVAREIVSPRASWLVRPLIWFLHLPTIGLLPAEIRSAYGYRWTRWHRILLKTSATLVRALLPWMPSSLRYWPDASRFWFGLLERSERVLE